MALTGWSTSNYLYRSASVVGAEPILISAWGYCATGSSTFRFAYTNGVSGSGLNRRALRLQDSDVAIALCTGASGTQAATSNTHPNNTWFHTAAAFMSSTSRSVWINAAGRGDDVTSMSPSAPDISVIGKAADANFPWPAAGGLAEVSVWDATGFTSGNLDSLTSKLYNGGAAGAGANPLNVTAESAQPWSGKLICYVIDSANTLTDLSGNGNTFSMQGTLGNFGSHPTIEAVTPSVPNTPIRPATMVSIVP